MSDQGKRPPFRPLTGGMLRSIEGGESHKKSLKDLNPAWELDLTAEASQLIPGPAIEGHRIMVTCIPRISQFVFNLVAEDGTVTKTFRIGGLNNEDGLAPTPSDLSDLEGVEKMLHLNGSSLAKEMLVVANIGEVRRLVRFGVRAMQVSGRAAANKDISSLEPQNATVLNPVVSTDPKLETLDKITPSWELDITGEWVSVMSRFMDNFSHDHKYAVKLVSIPRTACFVINFVHKKTGKVKSTIQLSGIISDDGLAPSPDDLDSLEKIEVMLKLNREPLAKEMLAAANIDEVKRLVRFGMRDQQVKGITSI